MQAFAFAAAPAFVTPVPFGPVCFDLGRHAVRAPRPVPQLRLTDPCATALAQLLPLLLCGEESAALAFGAGEARDTLAPAARAELERIRREEVVHGLLLQRDRKSTRLNSSHSSISYAVFCLKKKKI